MIPKTNLTPLPIGANATQWVQASDWSPLQQGNALNLCSSEFGAVSFPGNVLGTPNIPTVDCSPAIEAAFAALQFNTYFPTGTVRIPQGLYYFSRPIVPPTGVRIKGDGYYSTILCPGQGTVAQPGQVQGFIGPMILSQGNIQQDPNLLPTFAGPLVGSTGQSLVMTLSIGYYLHDSYSWSVQINSLTQMCIRFNTNVTNLGTNSGGTTTRPTTPPQSSCGFISSLGPLGLGPASSINQADSAFNIQAINVSPTTFKFQASLTTTGSGQQTILTSGVFNTATTYNVEMDYNGSFFDFYINGVNQGHVAMSGTVYRAPWECMSIGAGSYSIYASNPQPSINGFMSSIEYANVARHTGVGGFTPPTSAYVADANTLGLFNFDQGIAPNSWPFLLGQGLSGYSHSPSNVSNPAALIKHYCQIFTNNNGVGTGTTPQVHVSDLQLWCASQCSGYTGYQSPWNDVSNVLIFNPVFSGINQWDPGSFYCNFHNIFTYNSYNYGNIYFCLNSSYIQSLGCPIGTHLIAGEMSDGYDQPFGLPAQNTSYIPFIIGGSNAGINSICIVNGCDIDAEGLFPSMRAGVLVLNAGAMFFSGNEFDSAGGGGPGGGSTEQAPCIWYHALPLAGITHTNDIFVSGQNAAEVLYNDQTLNTQPNPGRSAGFITLVNCLSASGSVPLTNVQGWIQQISNKGFSNTSGISQSDVLANNLAGTFQVKFGSVNGNCTFITPEADGNYILTFQAMSHTGSNPAVGSTSVLSYTTSATGFTVVLGADPGGSCFLTFSYVLIRTTPPPLLFVAAPAIPSSYTNPLSGTNIPFGVGITIVPPDGKCFQYNTTAAAQTVVAEAGSGPGTNWWEMVLNNGGQFTANGDSHSQTYDSTVSTFSGQLSGLLNPGPHNIVAVSGSYPLAGPTVPFANIFPNYIDRAPMGNYDNLPFAAGPIPLGTQQTPIWVGKRSTGTQALTAVGSVRNLKVDPIPIRVFTSEPDAGPLAMAQAAYFGDSFTIGTGCSGGTGSWATQISSNRYGTTYYWMAAGSGQPVIGATSNGILNQFWVNWGTKQPLVAMTIWGGVVDLLAGVSATTIMAGLQGLTDGTQSIAYFVPPTTGTATCVINGVSFTATFVTDATTTVNNLIALINASGPTTAIVTPSLTGSFVPNVALQIQSVARGTATNSIPVSSNDANGAGWFEPIPSPFLGTPVTTMFGAVAGAITKGVTTIAFSNIPPFGANVGWSAAIETQRLALNVSIGAYVTAHAGSGVVLIDANTTLWNPANHTNLLPAYDSGDGLTINNAGHTAMHTLINPLIP